VRLRLIRNATLRVEFASRSLLVDPSLDPALAWDPIEGIAHEGRNPLAELPESAEEIVTDLDGVLVSHLHEDHWDQTAQRLLPAAVPLVCQSPDFDAVGASGFTTLTAVGPDSVDWLGIELVGTAGHHSNGPSREALGPVGGFVLRAPEEPSLWIVGDSVWCPELAEELDRHRPDVIVVNAGGAQLLTGERITMDAADVARVLDAAPEAQVVAVHMEAIGHCKLSREELRAELADQGPRLLVPADGETLVFPG
jgi:L-ascorbate metabolism protein UlaG (beta-lactamase superfamily)